MGTFSTMIRIKLRKGKSLLRIKLRKGREVMMSPFERGDGGGIPESGERIKIRHRGRSGVSTVVVIGKERLVILPVNGIGLFVGDVNDGGDGLEPGHVRIQKTYIVD